jgi:tetratricopeptide (TPR) repeat protein
MRRRGRCLSLGLACCLSAPLFAAGNDIKTANADLQAGKADEAIYALNGLLKSDPNHAEALNLLCRVEMTLEQFDKAAGDCEKAVNIDQNNAGYHHWLGRALGERASRASFLSAYSLAKRTRAEFETAVKLNPKDVESLADLGEFYKEAPGAVGGGMDKAETIAKQLEGVDASRAHELRGEMAEKQKDLPAAEKEYKSATSGPHPASAWMTLASFYRHHDRVTDAELAVESGVAAAGHDPHNAEALFN